MATRNSYTAVIERNTVWLGEFTTEPYEAAWAGEAIFFVRSLSAGPLATANVQISPDGIRWCDEGTTIDLPRIVDEVTFCRVKHFGGWLRLSGSTPPDQSVTVIAYLTLKE